MRMTKINRISIRLEYTWEMVEQEADMMMMAYLVGQQSKRIGKTIDMSESFTAKESITGI